MLLKPVTIKQGCKPGYEREDPDNPAKLMEVISPHLPGLVQSNDDRWNALNFDPVKQERDHCPKARCCQQIQSNDLCPECTQLPLLLWSRLQVSICWLMRSPAGMLFNWIQIGWCSSRKVQHCRESQIAQSCNTIYLIFVFWFKSLGKNAKKIKKHKGCYLHTMQSVPCARANYSFGNPKTSASLSYPAP